MRPERRRGAWLLAVALGAGVAAMPVRAEPVAAPVAEIRRVVREMKADSGENGDHVERELRWKRSEQQQRPEAVPSWLQQMARWLATAGRVFVWVLGALAVALLLVLGWRWARVRAEARRAAAALPPSHVNALDIRPASLPDDVGAAAAALNRRGEQRAALSLLYRGALSRLVHDHRVPIRAASTEGECARLAATALPAAGSAWFGRLVVAWQTEVYAGRQVGADAITALCDEFDAHLAARRLGSDGMPAMALTRA